jgi:hypothetical protein
VQPSSIHAAVGVAYEAEPFQLAGVLTSDWTGQGNAPAPSWSVPADIEQSPGLSGLLFFKESIMRGIGLWLLGVPVAVIIGLYLLNVI